MDDIKNEVKESIAHLAKEIRKTYDYSAESAKDLADAAAKLSVTLHNLTVVEDQEAHLEAVRGQIAAMDGRIIPVKDIN